MRLEKKLSAAAAFITAAVMTASTFYAADNAFQIDELNWTQSDWDSIAMTNDDTVKTGAVIRTEASENSAAAGYLYRGAAAKVIEKGEEWTLVESGKVTGYIKNEFLMFGDDARGLAAHYGEQGVTANWDDVNVYSGSSADSDISQTIDSGTALGMIEDGGHWITVQKDKDTAGYVSEEDVSRVLLVDTAVPAVGEDIEDVAVTMTASSASGNSDGDSSDTADSYTDVSSDETAYTDVSSDETAYTDTSSDEAAYTETSYTENTDAEWQQTTEDAAYTAVEETDSDSTYTADKVSDDPQIQALYEAFIEAQNAAMNCTSAEDAETKAASATAAWNAYLAACSGTSYTSGTSEESASTDVSSDAASEDAVQNDGAETASAVSEESSAEETISEDVSYTTESSEADDTSDDTSSDSSQSSEDSSAAVSDTQTSSENTGSYAGYSDLDLLAAIIWCEAGNQPYDGMVAVGQVVMNRVKSSSFPDTIAEVLNQPGQFTPASSGTLQAALAAGINSTCYSAASDALNGAAPVPGTPLYFNTHSGSYKLGDHYFS